jgi:hypothetical protein
MFVGLNHRCNSTSNPKNWTIGTVYKNIGLRLISWDQPMRYEDWVKNWVKRPPRQMSSRERVVSIFKLILCYTLVWLFLILAVPAWSKGFSHSGQFTFLAVLVYISLYFQGVWPSGTFPKWDRFAMLISFPLASVVFVIRQIFVLVGMVLTSLAAGAVGLGLVAIVIFVFIGIFGIILFGFRQVF